MNILSENYHLKIIDLLSDSSILKWHHFLNETKSYTESDIKEYQKLKLNEIIQHAIKNSDYYKELFPKSGVGLFENFFNGELEEFPILTKEKVRNNYNKLVSSEFRKFNPINRKTGGTTGEPVRYLYDKNSWSLGWALKIRDWEYGGYKFGNKMALLGGASLVPNQKKNLKRELWNGLNSFYAFSTTHYNNEILKTYYKKIIGEKIEFIRGYPSSLLGFAEFIQSNGLKIEFKSAFSTAEVLQEEHRNFIEEIFGCKIIDQYGAADACAHASECNHHMGFHISPEPSFCEFVNIEENFDGKKIAELVFTSLTNFSMPLIRYAPGDMAEVQESVCSCGRKTMMVKKIIGRTTERILFSNGKVLAGPAFTLIFRKFDIIKYQLVQNTKNSIDINLIKDEKYNLRQENEILKIMRFHCGDDVIININYVEEIPLIKSGKYRFIISNL